MNKEDLDLFIDYLNDFSEDKVLKKGLVVYKPKYDFYPNKKISKVKFHTYFYDSDPLYDLYKKYFNWADMRNLWQVEQEGLPKPMGFEADVPHVLDLNTFLKDIGCKPSTDEMGVLESTHIDFINIKTKEIFFINFK